MGLAWNNNKKMNWELRQTLMNGIKKLTNSKTSIKV